ncbi:MAG TPA: glycosyltransferase family 2 protein [bacterium]|nr:glycosyltransferase family 2 protein [bacterium]
MHLSVIVPVYNEAATVGPVIEKLSSLPLPVGDSLEIVAVDDASTDGSGITLAQLAGRGILRLITHPRNRGKGAALRSGIAAATGDRVLFHDADTEYDPADIPRLLDAARSGLDIVYGSRFLDGGNAGATPLHALANRFLSLLTRLLTGLPTSDMETCYKLVRADLLGRLDLREERFGIEPEITVKLGRLVRDEKLRYGEIPITYHPRGYDEGKKIGLRDGLRAVWALFRYRFF